MWRAGRGVEDGSGWRAGRGRDTAGADPAAGRGARPARWRAAAPPGAGAPDRTVRRSAAQDWGRRRWLAPRLARAFFLRRRLDDMATPLATFAALVPLATRTPGLPPFHTRPAPARRAASGSCSGGA